MSPCHTYDQAINLLRSPTGERIKILSPSGSTRNTLRIPEGALPMRRPYAYPARALPGAWFFQFFFWGLACNIYVCHTSAAYATRNTLRIPEGAYPLCPCDALTPTRRGPCRGLGFCVAAQKMRLVRAVILSYSAAHRTQNCELWNFLKQRKKV